MSSGESSVNFMLPRQEITTVHQLKLIYENFIEVSSDSASISVLADIRKVHDNSSLLTQILKPIRYSDSS